MGGLDAWLASVLVAHGINLLRLEADYQRQVLAILLQMEGELVAKLTGKKALTEFSRQRLTDLLAEARTMIAEKFIEVRLAMDPLPIATLEAEFVTKKLGEAIGVKLVNAAPTQAVLRAVANDALVQGGPASAWWARQGQDTAFRFANAVRQGVVQGETNAMIVARIKGTPLIPGIMETTRKNAEAMVRTSVQTISAAARQETYQANADIIEGFEQVSTLDSRTTDVCVAYDGAKWDLEYEPIAPSKLPYNGGVPRHWGCRSTMAPIVKPLVEGMPGFEPSERASKFGPTKAKTFAEWLDTQTPAFQDELLGTGKADLFRAKKITLQQLLDQRGRPLTLAQLRAKYA
ncbi:phage minor head protein [Variovorax sp. J22R193]|uniref:phage minor head protein n=1 Tax=Variovorax fucosicus TaxID=3053517 RepID=UPI002574F913|nr:phage minor head protein [Variovorax sp. J22R193]MDM0041871.1 phage minor head protein [Variovorax sp. J22R193]